LIKDILDRARTLQDQLLSAGEVDPDLQASQAWALLEVAATLQTLGDLPGALSSAQAAQKATEQLIAPGPHEDDFKEKLGAILRLS
jgi:hypothetical protein